MNVIASNEQKPRKYLIQPRKIVIRLISLFDIESIRRRHQIIIRIRRRRFVITTASQSRLLARYGEGIKFARCSVTAAGNESIVSQRRDLNE